MPTLYIGRQSSESTFFKLWFIDMCLYVHRYVLIYAVRLILLFLSHRFLFPLSVPHTVTVINLKPEKPSKKQLGKNWAPPRQNIPTTRKTRQHQNKHIGCQWILYGKEIYRKAVWFMEKLERRVHIISSDCSVLNWCMRKWLFCHLLAGKCPEEPTQLAFYLNLYGTVTSPTGFLTGC